MQRVPGGSKSFLPLSSDFQLCFDRSLKVLKRYNEITPQLELAGPTSFAPLIKSAPFPFVPYVNLYLPSRQGGDQDLHRNKVISHSPNRCGWASHPRHAMVFSHA